MSRIGDALIRAAVWPGDVPQAGAEEHRPHLTGAEAAAEERRPERTRAETRREQSGPDSDVPNWPVRAVAAPRTDARRQLGPFGPAFEGKLIVNANAEPICVEQYRRLAGTLHELQVEKGLKTLMVTSTVPSEGKTLTVANLALTLSESYGCRVLLIDADLRRPSVHEVFGLPNATGLGDVLRSERRELPLLQVSARLSILPAGRPDSNPMAGLTSDRMRLLLEQAAAEFDWVLLDAPPVGLMPDARLLAAATRAVLFVIGAGTTPYTLVQRAVAELGPECIVGTVLNRVAPETVPAMAYYQHYYS